MLSRFSIATTFAYQNTIYFLRFQTIYYLFLILFYDFMHAGDIFLIQPNLVHAILPAEQESIFYDTIVFHQNMLIGGYDDRSYTEILQPFFSFFQLNASA